MLSKHNVILYNIENTKIQPSPPLYSENRIYPTNLSYGM